MIHKVSTIISLLFLFIYHASAHNALLEPYSKVCFFEDMKKDDQLAVSFQVGTRDASSSEQPVIDFWIVDSHGERQQFLSKVANGDASMAITEGGRYEYCFSNEFAGDVEKDVTFHIHGVVYLDNDSNEPQSLDSEVRRLYHYVQEIKNEQNYIVIRERTHRNTAESTNARVKWWSIFQIIVVVTNSIFQIYYLKRFFEVKTNL